MSNNGYDIASALSGADLDVFIVVSAGYIEKKADGCVALCWRKILKKHQFHMKEAICCLMLVQR